MTWLDAWLDSDAEVSPNDVKEKLKEAVDTGLLVKKGKKSVILANNYEIEDNVIRFITQIPTVLVLKIEKATGFEPIYEKQKVNHGKNEPQSPSTES